MDDSIKEIEQVLSYYYQENVDPDLYEQSFRLRQELSSSLENLCWFLQDSPFSEATTYKTAFECFKFRLFYFPDEFSEEVLAELKVFLFDNALELTKNLSPNEISDMCTAQAYLSILIFPDIFPDLFDIAFEYPEILKFRFLSEFCQYLVLPTPQNIDKISQIKSCFDEYSFYEHIIEQIISGIDDGIPDSINALASFTRWTKDLSFLFDDQLMEKIILDESPEFIIPILKFIGSIAQRNIPEKKDELIQNFKIPERIAFYYQTYKEYSEIMSGCADTIQILVYSLETPLPEMYQLIEVFFEEDDEISAKVAGCYRVFARNNPELCDEIVENVIKRIVVFFENNPVTTFDFYLTKLLQILQECSIQNPDSFLGGYNSLLTLVKESDVSENMPSLSALIAITVAVYMLGIEFVEELNNSFFVTVRNIFEITPQIGEELFFPIYGINRLFLYRDITKDTIANDYNKEVLNQLSIFSLDDDLPDEVRKHFQVLLLQYVQRKSKFCSELVQYFEGFLNSRSKELMKVAGLTFESLIGKVKEQSAELCLGFIDQNLLAENYSIEDLSLSLDFLSLFSGPDVAHQATLEILQRISFVCTENDELLGKLILAIRGIGTEGFQLYNELLNSIGGIYSVQGAAETSFSFLKIFYSQNDQEGFQNTLKIADILIGYFIETTSQALSMPLNPDEVSQTRALISSCYRLFQSCFKFFPSDDESLGNLFEFTRDLMIRKYNAPLILGIIFKFLAYVSNSIPHEIASSFVEPSLLFILATNFDPDLTEWESMINKLIDFYSVLVEKVYQEFSESLSATLSNFGLDDFIQDFNISIEKDRDTREKIMLLKKVLIDILVARNSMTW